MTGKLSLQYRTLADLGRAAARLADEARALNVVAVAGVPRSGILAASLVALHLNCPLTDLRGLQSGEAFGSGLRLGNRLEDSLPSGTVLIVDDSVNSGREMARVRDHICEMDGQKRLIYAAVFATAHGAREVDLYGEIVPQPRVFEWNVLHHAGLLSRACFDLDGVLCVDPPDEVNDDGPRYREWMLGARKLFVPSARIGWIVTARLEKYRPETEAWLRESGIDYGGLVMLDGVTATERRERSLHAPFKAEAISTYDGSIFIESDPLQSRQIADISGRPVFCYGTRELLAPTDAVAIRRAPVNAARVLKARMWDRALGSRVVRRVRARQR